MPMPSKLPVAANILQRLRAGETAREIAKEFGVSDAAVHFRMRRAGYVPEDWKRKGEAVTPMTMPDVAQMSDEALSQAIDYLKTERSARFSRRIDESNFIIGKFMWQRFAPSLAKVLDENGHGDLAETVRQSLESEVV